LIKVLENKSLVKIRAITSFITLNKDKSTWKDELIKASFFGGTLADEFQRNEYDVQSIRIVTNAFGEYLDTSSLTDARKDMQYLSDILNSKDMPKYRIRFAIGEAKTLNEISLLPQLIREFGDICNACVNVPADDLGIINKDLTLHCAKAIQEISKITPRGEGNFNFTVNYNCKPLIPYFPASYHNSSDENCFALGLQNSDLLVAALKSLKKDKNHNKNLKNSFNIMQESLQFHATNIINITNEFNHKYKTSFAGIDSSAAPSKDTSSIVEIYKLLGVAYFGAAGTLEASALLTRLFKSIKGCPLIGFSGLMLALVEDQGLADSSLNDEFEIRSLLHYSSVCGIGLDTVPIPGNSNINKIADICSDTGTLAFRLNKPLTVRLFPCPTLNAGDKSNFISDDLCNSAVLAIP